MLTLTDAQLNTLRETVRAQRPDVIAAALRRQGVQVDETSTRSDGGPPRRQLSAPDASGFRTTLDFRPDGLLETLTQPSGAAHRLEYNAAGQLSAFERSGGGARIELKHDDNGQIIEAHQLGLARYRFGYEGQRLASVAYPDDTDMRFEHDEAGRLSAITDRGGATTRFERDERGELITSVDPLGRERHYYYGKDALREVEHPDGSVERLSYDPENGEGTITLRDGRKVNQQLTDAGALSQIAWPDADWTAFDYDADGRLAVVRNQNARVAFEYDAGGLPIRERSADGVVRAEYDHESRLVALGTPAGDTVQYTYDEDGRLESVIDWEGRVYRLEYAESGNVQRLHYGNGLTECQGYDPCGRLAHARVTNERGVILSEQRYRYDPCGRLSETHDSSDEAGWGERVDYDRAGRVSSVSELEVAKTRESFAYDAKGNMVQDGDHEVEIGLMDEVREYGESSIAYDGLGQVISLGAEHGDGICVHAANGTLKGLRRGDQLWRYAYDGLGRRIMKTDGIKTWRFGYHGHQLLWEEYQSAPDACPTRRDYLFLPDTVTPIAFREHGRTYYLQVDPRTAVVRAFEQGGSVVWRARYEAFGAAHVSEAKVRQPFRLAGQYHDEESGLHYSWARYYSPHLKTFLSRDPQWHDPRATNYSYCDNDPYNRTDPHGALAFLAAIAVGALVGAVVGGAISAATGGSFLQGAVDGAIGGAAGVVAVMAGPIAALAATVGGTILGTVASTAGLDFLRGDAICWECVAKDVGIALIAEAALFGLGKIPGVKKLAAAAGEKLSDVGDSLKKWFKRKPKTSPELSWDAAVTPVAVKEVSGFPKVKKAPIWRAKARPSGRAFELPADVKDIALRSPTLKKQLKQLYKDDWDIVVNRKITGGFAVVGEKRIVIGDKLPGYTMWGLTHEVGHAVDIPRGGLDPSGYKSLLDYKKSYRLFRGRGELNAQLNAAQIRQELIDEIGFDMRLSSKGGKGTMVPYEELTVNKYEAMKAADPTAGPKPLELERITKDEGDIMIDLLKRPDANKETYIQRYDKWATQRWDEHQAINQKSAVDQIASTLPLPTVRAPRM